MSYIGYYEGIHESCILMERLEGKDLFQVLMLNFKLKMKLKKFHMQNCRLKKSLTTKYFFKTLYQKRLRPAPSPELL